MSTQHKTDFSTLMYSFALGCLDKEDQKIMLKYFKTGGDFPWQDLGEHQNLAALLPSFLEIEEPDAQIKDKVARKLYRLKEQKRPERTTKTISQKSGISKIFEKAKTAELPPPSEPVEQAPPEPDEKSWDIPKELFNSKTTKETVEEDDYKLVRSNQRRVIESQRPQKTQIEKRALQSKQEKSKYIPEQEDFITAATPIYSEHSDTTENFSQAITKEEIADEIAEKVRNTIQEEADENKILTPDNIIKSKSGIPFGTLLFFSIFNVALIIILFLILSSQIKNTEKANDNSINNLEKSFQSSLISNNQLSEVMNYRDLQIVNLEGTNNNPEGFGKFLFSIDMKKGILLLSKLPVLTPDKVYKLWFNLGGNMVGKEIPYNGNYNFYYPINDIPALNLYNSIILSITEEPASGSAIPSRAVFFSGTYINK